MKRLIRKFLVKLATFKRRVLKEKLSPEAIAGGWALGMFIGCSIPFGLQLIISVPLAMMMRVSKTGATLGTFITNPFTIFFIYPIQTFIANKLLFDGSLTYAKLVEMDWSRESVMKLGTNAMASFFIGGILLAMIMTPLTYFAIKWLVISSRARRERKAQNL